MEPNTQRMGETQDPHVTILQMFNQLSEESCEIILQFHREIGELDHNAF